MIKYLSIVLILVLVACSKPDIKKEKISENTHTETAKSQEEGQEITTSTGLIYIDEVIGTGKAPKIGDKVKVHYTGTLEDGTKFDSSRDRAGNFTFPLGAGRVIKGWDQGVQGMKVGGQRTLIIPPSMGYGPRGAGNIIPPNATLVFDIELMGVQ